MKNRVGIAVSLSLIVFASLTGIPGKTADVVASAYESMKSKPAPLTVEQRLQALVGKIKAGMHHDSLLVEAMGLKADAAGTAYADTTAAILTRMQEESRKQPLVTSPLVPAQATQPRTREVAGIPIDADATIRTTPALLKATVEALRIQGYRCDSVSGIFTPQFSSRMQIDVYCNQDAYHYRVTDSGGVLLVEVR